MNRTTIAWLVGLATLSPARAQELGTRPPSWEPRVAVAKYLSPVGSLLVNEQPGQPWRSAGQRAELYSRDLLLALPGMQARLETTPRAVELILWGNLPEMSEFHGLQSAVFLHDSRAFDLDFTLQRGRVLVANRKEKGATRVWLRVDGAAFQLTLAEPGDAICLGLHSFWPRGVPFTLSPGPEDVPARTLHFLVVKGRVDLKVNGTQHSLSAPPGPASFRWDSVDGPEAGARNRRSLEAWADLSRKAPPSANGLVEVIDRYAAAVKSKEPRTALFDLLDSAANERQREAVHAAAEFAVFSLAAINDIDRVMQALENPRQAELRKAAVIALRHWIGDAPGRDGRLYQFLMDRLRYSKAQAATVLHMLHSALPAGEPDTYETLIAYLRHEKLAIRTLAWWQLSHLVPEDIAVPYDPAASPEERVRAYTAWKKAIPSGSLPSRKPKNK
ncbi:MAG TPA: hypothetical protein VMG10_31840 [Gemmataceae bacterium]|nr:hypothetical protein [Gemmataceae bacterium]